MTGNQQEMAVKTVELELPAIQINFDDLAQKAVTRRDSISAA